MPAFANAAIPPDGSVHLGLKAIEVIPFRVNVGVVPLTVAKFPVALNVRVPPVPEESIVAPFAPTVNKRLIETPVAEPVYFNVPPSMTKLLAALEELPIPLLDPPFTRDETDKTPPLMVVIPEYELVLPLAIVHVELPDFVNAEVPEVGFDQ